VRQVAMVTVTHKGRGSCQSPDHRSINVFAIRNSFQPEAQPNQHTSCIYWPVTSNRILGI